MSESMVLVGLDVHQAQTVAAVLDPSTGELRVERLRGEPASVVPVFLEELERPVAAVYEAGPTGFALARVAEERGLDVRVVAPGSIPRAPGDRVKTDRRDAKRLVRLFAAGELGFAFDWIIGGGVCSLVPLRVWVARAGGDGCRRGSSGPAVGLWLSRIGGRPSPYCLT
jgi:hypothetical protein